MNPNIETPNIDRPQSNSPYMMWLIWLYYLALLLVQLLGVALTLVGLPGLWLMVGALALYAWVTGFNTYVGWPSMVTRAFEGSLRTSSTPVVATPCSSTYCAVCTPARIFSSRVMAAMLR